MKLLHEMPMLPGLLRRRGQTSETNLNRRHSFFMTPEQSNKMDASKVSPRHSEQLPRTERLLEIEDAVPPASSPAAQASTPAVVISSPPEQKEKEERPVSPPVQQQSIKQKRFSMLKFRNASDSQLAAKARAQASTADAPPVPTRAFLPQSDVVGIVPRDQLLCKCEQNLTSAAAPEIITTAPTIDAVSTKDSQRPKMKFPTLKKSEKPGAFDEMIAASKRERRKTMSDGTMPARVTFDETLAQNAQAAQTPPPPPAYGEEGATQLALPVNRLSESSRSDGSDNAVYAQTTTTTVQTQTTTTFFRLPRRKKPGPLFPLPPKISQDGHPSMPQGYDKYGSIASRKSVEMAAIQSQSLRAPSNLDAGSSMGTPATEPSASNAMARATMLFAAPGSPLIRQDSSASRASNHSSPSRIRLGMRGRSSTVNSLRNPGMEDPHTLETPPLPSSRTSTSTARKSFGDLFSLPQRLRADPMSYGSGNNSPLFPTSKSNSMQITREPIVVPERHQDDSPAKYLLRLEEAVSRGVVASVLSKGSDTFSQQVLRSYMRSFGFFGDPMDMALRKLLMEVELPKETQHIDRCVQAFADRYHECNPGIYANPEQAYFIAFSLLILHTDVFNKNNKYKMQKPDYVKNTRGEGVFDEILECFYDNISYTPFIHVEDDFDINGERIVQHNKKKKSLFPRSGMDPLKRPSKEPIDPYTLIIDSKLDTLRPNLKEVMDVEEHYNYIGTAQSLNLEDLQKTFFRTGVLQIISARSRPDAFMSDKTVHNPQDAHPGIVDIKITKVGLLWRKDPKRKKTRSPWQEWGAILTGAQLYFFRNTTWIKSLIHQHESHVKQGHDGIPVVFKPPIDSFKPDALMSTDDAVALLDSNYKKHKNAFLFVRHGGFEETFLADSELEMNDWLAKLNYAAAFRTAGVRMRGVVGGNYEGQRSRGIRRLDSAASSKSISTPSGDVQIVSGRIDTQMAADILSARREIMLAKIADAEEKLRSSRGQLEAQLRNARHLQILAPIHPRTREQVVLAAGRMSAKLKWSRMEMWRLKCHRDILTMDLDEEAKTNPKVRQKIDTQNLPTILHTMPTVDSSSGADPEPLSRVDSKKSGRASLQVRPETPSRRPSTYTVSTTGAGAATDDEQLIKSPTSATSQSEQARAHAAWELPPFDFHGLKKAPSATSKASTIKDPKSPVLSHVSSFPSMRHIESQQGNRAVSGPMLQQGGEGHQHDPACAQPDANEHIVLEQAGLISPVTTADDRNKHPAETTLGQYISGDHDASAIEGDIRQSDRKDDKLDRKEGDELQGEGKKEKDKSKIGTVRRSIHRTLRDAHVPSQHGSRKHKHRESGSGQKDSESSAEGLTKDDHLARGTGSFVVHGKKASVITFGDALVGMTPEERLGRLRAGHDGTGAESSPVADKGDFHEQLMKRDGRVASDASTHTATARSFRELHKRLSVHAANADERERATSSGHLGGEDAVDSDAAASFSEGRRTPLPPVLDEEAEEEKLAGEGVRHEQAMFYSPEVPGTPIFLATQGKAPSRNNTPVTVREIIENAEGKVMDAKEEDVMAEKANSFIDTQTDSASFEVKAEEKIGGQTDGSGEEKIEEETVEKGKGREITLSEW